MIEATNQRIADGLREYAGLPRHLDANPFWASAFHRVADTVADRRNDWAAVARRARPDGLTALPGVRGSSGAASLDVPKTGDWIRLTRLRGTLGAGRAFGSIAGIDPGLAGRIPGRLQVDTSERLAPATKDGRRGMWTILGPDPQAAWLPGVRARYLPYT